MMHLVGYFCTISKYNFRHLLYKQNLAFFWQTILRIQNYFAFTIKIYFMFCEVKT